MHRAKARIAISIELHIFTEIGEFADFAECSMLLEIAEINHSPIRLSRNFAAFQTDPRAGIAVNSRFYRRSVYLLFNRCVIIQNCF